MCIFFFLMGLPVLLLHWNACCALRAPHSHNRLYFTFRAGFSVTDRRTDRQTDRQTDRISYNKNACRFCVLVPSTKWRTKWTVEVICLDYYQSFWILIYKVRVVQPGSQPSRLTIVPPVVLSNNPTRVAQTISLAHLTPVNVRVRLMPVTSHRNHIVLLFVRPFCQSVRHDRKQYKECVCPILDLDQKYILIPI